jgi:hypothetical protein
VLPSERLDCRTRGTTDAIATEAAPLHSERPSRSSCFQTRPGLRPRGRLGRWLSTGAIRACPRAIGKYLAEYPSF